MIKNIIFDLGGVLVDLNPKETFKCFGGKLESFYGAQFPHEFIELMNQFERGEISADFFRESTCNMFSMLISKARFEMCWNAMIGSMHTNTILMLLELRKKYRIFALSNNNQIHYDYLIKKDFWEPFLFEETYFSHLVGMKKSEKRIFEFVLNDSDLNPAETFFIDDVLINIESAASLGIQTLHYDGKIPIYEKISQLFNIKLPKFNIS